MRGKRLFRLNLAAGIVCASLICVSRASGETETILHSFRGQLTHGSGPHSPLFPDGYGNFYGTTYYGGDANLGTVYKLTPASGGGWTQTVLHSFKSVNDGSYPEAGVILDSAGNLYGTTAEGGQRSSICGARVGCGVVFKLTPNSSGGWTESVIYSFQGGSDGTDPVGGLVLDPSGNLYGTTTYGGEGKYGTVFKLTPSSDATWTESVIFSFAFNSETGTNPSSSLVFDAKGNLYGTTESGGTLGNGVVFELTPNSNGTWTESVLYTFAGGSDGATPVAPLIFDATGNLYGTTGRGGGFNGGAGTAFELKPNGGGGWTEVVLYRFGQTNSSGLYPDGGLAFDAAGNLYGTTDSGGNTGCYSNTGCGVVFQLTPGFNGQWTENILHIFSGGPDGGIPYAGLILDQSGNLYGTTGYGGAANLGAVFELSPLAGGQWKSRTLYWFPGEDGIEPYSSLVFDKAGNLYGTTSGGGVYQNGSVFKLTPNGIGGWTDALLYSFKGSPDGARPIAGLVFDNAGNLYGTTSAGGTGVCPPYTGGCGGVFKLTPSSNGSWTESVLYSFQGGTDGDGPLGGLTFGKQGGLYGTTSLGGQTGSACDSFGLGCGVVFELMPSSGGKWTERVIYAFTGGADSGEPHYVTLAIDAAGNLYGTTSYTGCDGCYDYYTTVFELARNHGGWTQNTLYTFTDASVPDAGVILDSAGNLYGTTAFINYGGVNGTVFKLTPSSGSWTRDTLYSFTGGSDGGSPVAALVFDGTGNLYGTTVSGGAYCYLGCGVAFKLAPGEGGQWTESVLHTFGSGRSDGVEPYSGLILDAAGNLYGTTYGGGSECCGAVFEITP